MQRPKQQALAFLLGALLVGGVVGFSADRAFRHDDTTIAARRKALYDDLGLEARQRHTLDSLLDDRNCQLDQLFKPLQHSLDSVRAATRAQMDLILTSEQRAKLEAHRREDDARKDAERKQVQASCRR
jgi:hypothetical protein